MQVGARTSLQPRRKEDRRRRKQDKRGEEKECKNEKQVCRTAPSQTASSSASANTANRQLAHQRSRTERSQTASPSVSTTIALPSLRNNVHGWCDGSCLNQGSRLKRPRAGLGVHFPQSNSSGMVFGAHTHNRAEAMACLRVLQHVQRSWYLHRPEVAP